ncbi:MAG: hypothetical protein KGZ97_03140 [Bacteroidetes bacterium]|nr:hypothetical protein [Bacteroidota bacterium]
MYNVKSFSKNAEFEREFIMLPSTLYHNDKNYVSAFSDEVSMVLNGTYLGTKFLTNNNFLLYKNNKVAGRLIAFINPRINIDNGHLGTVGFIECENDYEGFSLMMNSALTWLKENGVNTVWGPMSGSLWMANRFMTKGFEKMPFFKEPYNKPYYNDFFEKYGFKVCKTWASYFIDKTEQIETILKRVKPKYDRAINMGYTFRSIDYSNFEQELSILYELISDSFKNAPGFNEIDKSDFMEMFRPLKRILKAEYTKFTVSPDGKEIGYMLLFPDIAKAIASMKGKSNLLSKLKFLYYRNSFKNIIALYLGIVQSGDKQHLGLGGAQAYLMAKHALQYNNSIICGLVADNSFVNAYVRNDYSYSHEYALYSIII